MATFNYVDEGRNSAEFLEGTTKNDSLNARGGDDTIAGYAGNDYLIGGDDNDSINGGKGNDTLTGSEGDDIFVYANGDGNDVITDYEVGDKIQFTSGTPKFAKKGNDVIITVGKGKITVKGAAEKTITYIDAEGEEKQYPIPFIIEGTNATLLEAYSKDSFNIADYDEDIVVKTIDASAVQHDISITANKLANTIIGTSQDDYIDGGAGADVLDGGKGNDTILGGKGNDNLTGGDGSDVFVFTSSDGKDVITDYNEEDVIKITSGTISKIAKSGNNVVFTFNKSNTITVKDAADKIITYIDAGGTVNTFPADVLTVNSKGTAVTLKADYSSNLFDVTTNAKVADYAGTLKTIDASAVDQDIEIVGNKNANYIVGGIEDDTIIGGKGADILKGGAGQDVFVYNSGDGKDVITDYSEEDVIKIASGTINENQISTSGNNVIFTFDKSNTITVKDANNKVITYIDKDGIEHTYSNNPIIISPKQTEATILSSYSADEFKTADYSTKIKKVDASAVEQDLRIIANKLANTIIGTSQDDYIDGDAGADVLDGGKGNDSLVGGTGNDTLIGNKGNDTLAGGAGADVFVYSSGDGKDVITDYSEEDKIKIASGEVSNISVKGSDVIFVFNKSNTLTVKNAKDSIVTYIDKDGNEQTFPKIVEYNAKGTSATLLSAYSKDEFAPADYSDYEGTLKTIDGSAVDSDVAITGNKLANKIIGGDGNNILNGGKGNDMLTGGDGADTFVYNNDGTKDVITDYNYKQGDVIQINGTVKKVADSGTNVVFTVGKGTLTVNKAAGKYEQAVVYQVADGEQYTVHPVTDDDIVIEGNIARALESYNGESINLNDDKFSSTVTAVDASAVQHDIEIIGNSNKNSLLGSTQNDTLNGGKGNDTLTGGEGSDVFIYKSGDGNDVITDYDEEDIIKFTSGKATVKTKGNNVIFAVGKSSITVAGGKDHVITYEDDEGTKIYPEKSVSLNADGTAASLLKNYRATNFDATTNVYVADYADILKTIDGSAVTHDIAITANGKANKIIGSTHNDTLAGGKGADTLTGGEGQDIFVYNAGDGKDVIADYTEGEDVIQIASGEIKGIVNKGDNVVFTVGTGSITVKDAKNKVIKYIDADGVERSYPTPFIVDGKTVTLTEKYYAKSFNINDYDELSSITQIDASAVTGDIAITGNKSNNIIIGAAGDNTINGAKGNDTLYGGDGANTYLYASGDGNDLIIDYNAGGSDIVSITSGRVDNESVKGDTVILKVGKGRISLAGGADNYVTWYDDDGRHSKYYSATGGMFASEDDMLLDDSNAQLSSIVNNSSVDYSFGKVDYGKETAVAEPDYAVAYSDKK